MGSYSSQKSLKNLLTNASLIKQKFTKIMLDPVSYDITLVKPLSCVTLNVQTQVLSINDWQDGKKTVISFAQTC